MKKILFCIGIVIGIELKSPSNEGVKNGVKSLKSSVTDLASSFELRNLSNEALCDRIKNLETLV